MRQLGGVAALLLIAVTMAGCSSKPAATVETTAAAEQVATVQVPDLAGMKGDDARDAVEGLGLEVEWDAGDKTVLMASNWTVTGQDPAAGTPLPDGGTVTVSVAKPTEAAEPDPTQAAPTAAAPVVGTDVTSGGVDEFAAQHACDDYGDAQFPFGFKAHWIIDKLAAQITEDQWFLKAGVTIENAYGNEYDTVFECTVGGTETVPIVSGFVAYP